MLIDSAMIFCARCTHVYMYMYVYMHVLYNVHELNIHVYTQCAYTCTIRESVDSLCRDDTDASIAYY